MSAPASRRAALASACLAAGLSALMACGEPHVGGEDTSCATDAECVRAYDAALQKLRACLGERNRTYVGPGGAQPPECDSLRAESDRWGNAVRRLRGVQRQEAFEDAGGGFEVPPLPPGQR